MATLFSLFAPKRRVNRSHRGSFRPLAEALEERCCPSGGSVEWSDPSISGAGYSVAVKQDGHIIAGGRQSFRKGASGGINQYSALFGFNSNGTVDSTFGSGGVVLVQPITNYGPALFGVAIQTDGKIVATGAAGTQLFVMRFNANGSLDTTFGGGKKPTGIASITVTSNVTASAVALQTDGKIVVSGNSWTSSTGSDFMVVRLTSAGTLDSTFGSGGIVSTDLGNPSTVDNCNALAIQSDGKILLAGDSDPISGGLPRYGALVRYTTNGTLDSSFATGGKLLFLPPGTNDGIEAGVAVQTDGSIVVSGVAQDSSTSGTYTAPVYIARITTAGQLDTTFGSSGYASTSAIRGIFNNRIVIDAYGGLVVCGTSAVYTTDQIDIVLGRFLSTGALDTTFGVNGITPADLTRGDSAIAMTLQTNGNILVVGTTNPGNGQIFALVSFTGGTTMSLGAASTPATSPTANTASSTQAAAALDAFWASDADALSFSNKLIGATAA